MKKYIGFKILLWVIGAYHVLVGLLFNGPRTVLVEAGKLAGITRMPDEGVFYLAKPFGIYLIIFGVAMWLAAWNPVKNRALISLGVVLFGLRIVQRALTMTQTEAMFGIGSAMNLGMMGIVLVFALLLLAFRLLLFRDMHNEGVGQH